MIAAGFYALIAWLVLSVWLALRARSARDRLSIWSLRRVNLDLDPELPLQAVNYDLHVRLSKTGYQSLTRFSFTAILESRVFVGESRQRRAQFVLVCLGLRLDGDRIDRRGELDRRILDRLGLVTQGVAGTRGRELRNCSDIARVDLRCGLLVLASQQVHLADPLVRTLGRVENMRIRLQ